MINLNPTSIPMDHLVEFYDHEKLLYDSVIQYICTGLEGGEGIIVVATPAHLEAFSHGLQSLGFDFEAFRSQGQIVVGDAATLLAQFMNGDVPDGEKFRTLASGMIEGLLERFPKIRIYGEMVNILMVNGNLTGTIGLENLWNALRMTYPFTLLCGYVMSNFNESLDDPDFIKVCQTHSHVSLPHDDMEVDRSLSFNRETLTALQTENVALQTELTGRKKIEMALREALQIRDESFAIVSHELKTPLTSLRLQIDLLKRETHGLNSQTNNVVKRAIQVCDYNLNRIIQLVDHILDITQIRLGRLKFIPVEFELGTLTREVISYFSNSPSLITVHCEEPVVGTWDKIRLEQIITNLLSNAIKYGEGKPINVYISRTQGGTHASLVVEDFGIGISQNDQQKIFKRFERASSSSQLSGLGLGLYIVHQIVSMSGGIIAIQSEPGHGSKFIVELPLSPRESWEDSDKSTYSH